MGKYVGYIIRFAIAAGKKLVPAATWGFFGLEILEEQFGVDVIGWFTGNKKSMGTFTYSSIWKVVQDFPLRFLTASLLRVRGATTHIGMTALAAGTYLTAHGSSFIQRITGIAYLEIARALVLEGGMTESVDNQVLFFQMVSSTDDETAGATAVIPTNEGDDEDDALKKVADQQTKDEEAIKELISGNPIFGNSLALSVRTLKAIRFLGAPPDQQSADITAESMADWVAGFTNTVAWGETVALANSFLVSDDATRSLIKHMGLSNRYATMYLQAIMSNPGFGSALRSQIAPWGITNEMASPKHADVLVATYVLTQLTRK